MLTSSLNCGAENIMAVFIHPMIINHPGGCLSLIPIQGMKLNAILALMNHLGVPDGSVSLEFPISDEDITDFNNLNFPLEKNKYVCVHPGSTAFWRQWPTENFARMADFCMDNGLQVVITGSREELEITERVASQMKHDPLMAAGKTNLGSMAVLLRNSFALISNSTGISHMAAALNVPGIIISMDGEPLRWGPLDKELLYTCDWVAEPDYEKAESALMTLIRRRNLLIG